MSLSLLPDNKRVLIIAKDVTSQKLFEEQSKLASMGEMIGNIAHQWRQPLSIITTSASGLKLQSQMGMLDEKQIEDYNDLVLQQAQYLSHTIDNFRDFIKGETIYKDLFIHDLIDQTISLVDASLKNNYIETIKQLDGDLQIYGNINELIQALINIITNAKDALKEHIPHNEKRVLFISTKKLDEHSLELKIKDNGGGIKEEVIHRIFEPYFTTKHQSIGTGLGLSMVDKILRERHHCQVSVYNEEFEFDSTKYTGACFSLIFYSNNNDKLIK